MNAMIKLTNMSYLQVLQELLYSKITKKEQKNILVKLPLFNLIALLVTIYTKYVEQNSGEPLNIYILNYFITKYRSASEVYRHMLGAITIWKKYLEGEPEARLFLSVLNPQRSQKEEVKLFLKIRKAILRSLGPKLMQDVNLTHQDILTLSHTIFTSQMKGYTAKKIHELFLALNKKSIHTNKINGAVACEFLMNCAEKFQRQELENIRYKEEEEFSSFQEEQQVVAPMRFHKPVSNNSHKYLYQVNHPEISFTQDQSYNKSTGVFRLLHDSPQKKAGNFLLNNLRSAVKDPSRESLSPAKTLISQKYSYSWQRYLKTNQQAKQKLLKPHK